MVVCLKDFETINCLLKTAYAIAQIKYDGDYVTKAKIESFKLFIKENKDLLMETFENCDNLLNKIDSIEYSHDISDFIMNFEET